jgi:hypothetical protein
MPSVPTLHRGPPLSLLKEFEGLITDCAWQGLRDTEKAYKLKLVKEKEPVPLKQGQTVPDKS